MAGDIIAKMLTSARRLPMQKPWPRYEIDAARWLQCGHALTTGEADLLALWCDPHEAHLALRETPGQYDIVYPSRSILAEPPVALVDKNVDKHGTRKVAEAFLQFLYTPAAQEIEAKDFYRPRNQQILAKYKSQFPDIALVTIDGDFGGWDKAQATHFGEGGVFDQSYQPGK